MGKHCQTYKSGTDFTLSLLKPHSIAASGHINATTVGKPLAAFLQGVLHVADLPVQNASFQLTNNLLTGVNLCSETDLSTSDCSHRIEYFGKGKVHLLLLPDWRQHTNVLPVWTFWKHSEPVRVCHQVSSFAARTPRPLYERWQLDFECQLCSRRTFGQLCWFYPLWYFHRCWRHSPFCHSLGQAKYQATPCRHCLTAWLTSIRVWLASLSLFPTQVTLSSMSRALSLSNCQRLWQPITSKWLLRYTPAPTETNPPTETLLCNFQPCTYFAHWRSSKGDPPVLAHRRIHCQQQRVEVTRWFAFPVGTPLGFQVVDSPFWNRHFDHWQQIRSSKSLCTKMKYWWAQVFSMVAKGKVDWSSTPVTITISFGGPNFENILFEISNIPEDKVGFFSSAKIIFCPRPRLTSFFSKFFTFSKPSPERNLHKLWAKS